MSEFRNKAASKAVSAPKEAKAAPVKSVDSVDAEKQRLSKLAKDAKLSARKFDISKAMKKDENGQLVSALDANGKLTVATPEGYVYRRNLPLDETDFATKGIWMEHRACKLEAVAAVLCKTAVSLREKAKFATMPGGDKVTKDVNKVQKLAADMEKLKAKLAGEGVDVDALLAKLAAQKAAAQA